MPAVAGLSKAVPGAELPSYASGRLYRGPYGATTTNAGTILDITTATNDLFYTPMYIRKSTAFNGAAIFMDTTATNSGLARLGVYADSNGTPGSLVVDFGAVTLPGASNGFTVISSNVTLSAGWYWLAYLTNVINVLGAISAPSTGLAAGEVTSEHAFPQDFGLLIDSSTTALYTGTIGYKGSTAYGAFAATAVAPASNAGTMPAVWLRAQ